MVSFRNTHSSCVLTIVMTHWCVYTLKAICVSFFKRGRMKFNMIFFPFQFFALMLGILSLQVAAGVLSYIYKDMVGYTVFSSSKGYLKFEVPISKTYKLLLNVVDVQ